MSDMVRRADLIRAEEGNDVFRAVAHPVRRVLVERLARGDAEAGDLAELVWDLYHLPWPSTSNHLRVLREAGVVASTVDTTFRIYSLRPGALGVLRRWVDRCAGDASDHPGAGSSR